MTVRVLTACERMNAKALNQLGQSVVCVRPRQTDRHEKRGSV